MQSFLQQHLNDLHKLHSNSRLSNFDVITPLKAKAHYYQSKLNELIVLLSTPKKSSKDFVLSLKEFQYFTLAKSYQFRNTLFVYDTFGKTALDPITLELGQDHNFS